VAGFLADVIVVVHFGYLAFVVFGGFLAWRRPKVIVAHVLAAGWGVAILTVWSVCPLTYAEDWFRRRAGQGGLTRGFIDTYVKGVLYPVRYEHVVQALVAVIVLVSWVGAYRLARHRRRTAGRPASLGPARTR
jgi:hypothetical protein